MNVDSTSWTGVRMALRAAFRIWGSDPNVAAIDYGWAKHGGRLYEDELAIRVHVKQKYRERQDLALAILQGLTDREIPDSFAGYQVDVPVSGPLMLQQGGLLSRIRRADPIQGGISVSNASLRGSGTLGGVVRDRQTGEPMILSNWHVLAGYWAVRPGWPISQPGRGDGGRYFDVVATYSRSAMSSHLDAAVARLTGNRSYLYHAVGLGPVQAVGWAVPGTEVIKSGRTTGVTRGRVTGVEGYYTGYYGGVYGYIRNVMVVEPYPGTVQAVSAAGDSGSVWLQEETMHAVGLHFAGNESLRYALAIDMQPIVDALDVDMVF